MILDIDEAKVILDLVALSYSEGQGPENQVKEKEMLIYIKNNFIDLTKEYRWCIDDLLKEKL
jgi:hypothetical protein